MQEVSQVCIAHDPVLRGTFVPGVVDRLLIPAGGLGHISLGLGADAQELLQFPVMRRGFLEDLQVLPGVRIPLYAPGLISSAIIRSPPISTWSRAALRRSSGRPGSRLKTFSRTARACTRAPARTRPSSEVQGVAGPTSPCSSWAGNRDSRARYSSACSRRPSRSARSACWSKPTALRLTWTRCRRKTLPPTRTVTPSRAMRNLVFSRLLMERSRLVGGKRPES